MPLQNRVTPDGRIIAVSERGRWMGNRGCLHDDNRQLGRALWKHPSWVICTLEPLPGRSAPRQLMAPRHYTELFFLDEATALSAGHRPCARCRRAAHDAFREAAGGFDRTGDLDQQLHRERVAILKGRAQPVAQADSLPDGAFIKADGQAMLIAGGQTHPWTPGGYEAPRPLPRDPVPVLTPATSLKALANGYAVQMAL